MERHPMESDPEYDPDHQRSLLRERLEELAWDAYEGYMEVGDERFVTEPGLLTPGIDDEDLTWKLVYRGGQNYRVYDPVGEDRGEVTLEWDCEEDPLEAFGEATVDYHREQKVVEARQIDEVGGSVLFPIVSKVVLTGDDRFEIHIAGELETIVPREDLTVERIEEVVEDWRDRMADRYGDAW